MLHGPNLTFFAPQSLQPVLKFVMLESGKKIQFKKCLIATGSSPTLPKGLETPEDDPRVSTFRTAQDFQALYRAAKAPDTKHITVIGGGFLGTELVGALAQYSSVGLLVSQIVQEPGVMSHILPDYLSDYVTSKLRKNAGVEVFTSATAKSIAKTETGRDRLVVTLDDGTKFKTDYVVVATGATPNVSFAEDANLEIDRVRGGVVVNHEFQARSDIYAAGDVASYWDYLQSVRRREAHHEHAYRSGNLAGLNMAGNRRAYSYEPSYKGIFNDDSYLAVGLVDSKLETVGVWQNGPVDEKDSERTVDTSFEDQRKFDRGAVYYLNDKKRVVGVLLWNMLDHVEEARHALIPLREFTDINDLKRQISLGDPPVPESEAVAQK